MTVITASLNKILKLAAFASDEETRYYLQGVAIQAAEEFAGNFLVATDGSTLGMFEDRLTYTKGEPPAINVAPTVVLKTDKAFAAAAKRVAKDFFRFTSFERLRIAIELPSKDGDGITHGSVLAQVYLHEEDTPEHGAPGKVGSNIAHCITVELINGTYPNWAGVFPTSIAPVSERMPMSINSAYVARFTLGKKDGACVSFFAPPRDPKAKHDWATQPILVLNAHERDFCGLLMPYVGVKPGYEPLNNAPAWLLQRIGAGESATEEKTEAAA